jgi:hypothetical protein
LVAQAETARAAGNQAEAERLYNEAYLLDPNNIAAANGRASMQNATVASAGMQDPLARRQTEVETRKQYIRYSFDTSLVAANEALRRNDFTASSDALNRARVARDTDPSIFTPKNCVRWINVWKTRAWRSRRRK